MLIEQAFFHYQKSFTEQATNPKTMTQELSLH
jgi:hypothetical protein